MQRLKALLRNYVFFNNHNVYNHIVPDLCVKN